MSALNTATQHNAWSSRQCNKTRRGNKRHTEYKGRNKTVHICRWHDYLHRKSEGCYDITPKTKK